MNKELIRLKRIEVEKKLVENESDYYINNGIFLEYDKNNNNIVYILYIIKNDNIYKYSQHLFKFEYTENYPFDPPTLTYLSARRKARLHPNFYANGKCCLSLLGTWNGPQWTSCNNITSIINSIIPLFSDNPIQFEPTFENIVRHKKTNDLYNLYILYECNNLLHYNLINPIINDSKLNKIMLNNFKNNYNNILINFKKLEKENNREILLPVYNYKIKIDYYNLINDFKKLYNENI